MNIIEHQHVKLLKIHCTSVSVSTILDQEFDLVATSPKFSGSALCWASGLYYVLELADIAFRKSMPVEFFLVLI
ncbi:hypothetical protein J6590_077240 [Homalodisca vitripennis]|nr:hypothetical protein J6590_077240 [Homalodisca vitripennis]